MKVYEFPARIGPKGNLELPEALVKALANEELVRVIIMVSESTETDEDTEWSRFSAHQLLTQYDEADAVYDT